MLMIKNSPQIIRIKRIVTDFFVLKNEIANLAPIAVEILL